MKVTRKTKWSKLAEVWQFADDKEANKIAEGKAIEVTRGKGGFYTLTLSEFIEIVEEKNYELFNLKKDRAVNWLSLAGFFDVFLPEFTKVLNNLTPQGDVNEKMAEGATLKCTLSESLLIFTRNYFGLHSFEEAGKILLSDIVLAKKDNYNQVAYQRAIINQQRKGLKR